MSQFKYLFFVAGANGKRELCSLDSVEEKIEKSNKTDIFTSLFYYNNDVVTYFQKNSTSRGYRGIMFSPHLVFDIDSSLHQSVELNIIDAIEKQKHLLEDLKTRGITSYRISFSSSKGFHTVIPSDCFGGFDSSSSLPAQLLSLAKQITTVDFDKSIFSNLRIFRVINTKSSKSGLYKIPITEAMLSFPDKILELAKNPQQVIPIKSQGVSKELTRLKERAFELVPEEHIFSGTTNRKAKNKLCILKLLEGVDTGERNEALCRLVAHFKQEGYTPEFAFELVLSWNKFNKQQESIDVLKSTFESIWNGGFSYGCFDWLLDSHCDKSCYLYRSKISKEESVENEFPIYSIVETQKFYDKFVKEDRRVRLGISSKIDDMIKGIAPQEIAVILGRPAGGKSTVAMHMGYEFVKNYSGCFLYISLEMSLAMMYERQMQIVLGQQSDFIEKNYPNLKHDENLKRFLVSDRTNISVKQIKKAVLDYQDRTGDKIEFIVVDYLHAMKGDGQDERSKINNTVQDLTALAKELDTRLMYLAHVHRTSMLKDDSVYLPVKMGDGRDSSTIENSAFFIFGVHLIRDDPNVVMFQLLKNKNGMPFPSGVRLIRETNSLQLKEEKLTVNLDDL